MHRRAFAILLALAIMALLGGLVWSYSNWTISQVRRNALDTRTAQLRQLLLAGLELAPQVIHSNVDQQAVALPPELTPTSQLHITILHRAPEAVDVEILANVGTTSQTQKATFNPSTKTWTLAAP